MPHDTYSARYLYSAITFDTSSSRDDYRCRLALMTRELKTLAPDILLLQNVFAMANNRYNTAGHLAQQLGMDCAFLPMRPKIRHLDGRPVQSHSGLAILSRHPIIESGRVELPRDPRDGQRVAQFADIDIMGTRLMVANIQLSHFAGHQAVRRHQVERLAALIADAHDYDHILVGGDFNAGPTEPALEPLRKLAGFAVSEAAPERGVDRLFALTRSAAHRPLAPAVLTGARLELDRADAISNQFAGERAALACEMTLSDAVSANITSVQGATDILPVWANRPQNRVEPRISAFQTAAE